MPKQNNTATAREQFVPIVTEYQAQSYGWNVHSLLGASDDRRREAWEDAIRTWDKPEPPRRPTLAEIMNDPDPSSGGGAAA